MPGECLPPTIRLLPAEDGDQLSFRHLFINPEVATPPFAISAGFHPLPDSTVGFEVNATISGGTFDVKSVGITTRSTDQNFPGTFPVLFNGTIFQTNQAFAATASSNTLTLSAVAIESPLIQLNGVYGFGEGPPPDGTPLIWINGGSEVTGGVIKVSQDFSSPGEIRVNMSESSLSGFGLEIGFLQNQGTAQLNLMNISDATPSQFVVVGKEGRGKLELSGESTLISLAAYGIVGADGPGFLHVKENSVVRLNQIEIGLRAQGDLALDTGGKLFTNDAFIGRIVGFEGTANLETEGRWETGGLTVGEYGTGRIYVRDGGTLKINNEGVLGKNPGGYGVLNLIGSQTHLELGASGMLTIGKEGTGELNLSEGATYTSEGNTLLADVNGGTGIVTVDGQGSTWTVNGYLYIGERGTGRVEVRNQGKLTATGAAIRLGSNENGDGTLLVDGADTTLDFDDDLFSGYWHKGNFQVHAGANVTVHDLTLGFLEDSEGKLEVLNINSSLKTTGDLIVGREGRGEINVSVFGKMTTEGDAVFGEFPSSGTPENANAALVSGQGSEWNISGDLTVGKRGVGLITVQDRAVLKTTGNAILGDEQNSTGEVDLEMEVETAWEVNGALTIGKHGTGIVDMTSGTLHAKGPQLLIGELQGSTGTLSIEGGVDQGGSFSTSVTVDGLMRVGDAGTGTLILKDGGGTGLLTAKGPLSFGVQSTGDGKAEITGGDLTADDELRVGGEGKGKIEITQGGIIDAGDMVVIDATAENNAIVEISGVGDSPSRLKAAKTIVGELGYGKLMISGGARIAALDGSNFGVLQVAAEPGSHGKLTVSDHAEVRIVNFNASATDGQGGVADVDVLSQGKIDATTVVTLGSSSETGNVEFDISDGGQLIAKEVNALNKSATTVSNAGKILLKSNGKLLMGGSAAHPATLTIESGGELTAQGGATLTQFRPGFHGKAIVNVNSGGIVDVEHIEVGSAGQQAVGGTQVTISGASSLISASNSLIVHPGATVTAAADGRIHVQNAAAINGTVDVLAGSMQIGPIVGGPVGEVSVFPGGTLSGRGLIKGKLHVQGGVDAFTGRITGGRIQPGNSPGTLTIEGDLIVEENTIIELEIGGLVADAEYDVFNVLGNADIDGNVLLKFIDGFAPSIGDQFTLINAATSTIAPDIYVRNLAPGWQYDISQQGGAWMVNSLSNAVFIRPGDYNRDGFIDAADYTVWRDTLGQAGFELAADGNDDGVVDPLDYAVWQGNFGTIAGSAAASHAAAPEPSTAAMLILAVVGICSFQHRKMQRTTAKPDAL